MKISPNMFAPSIGAQNFSYAPGMQPAPPVNPLFAQPQGNPRREMFSDILMAIGTGLASGNMGNSAQMLAQFSKDRDERKRASMGQNATMEWLKARKADDIIPLVQSGQITPMQAIEMATQAAPERKMFKAADGKDYWQDTLSPVFPGMQTPAEIKMATEEAEKAKTAEKARENAVRTSNIVVEDIDRAIGIMDNQGFSPLSPLPGSRVAGIQGMIESQIPGTPSADFGRLLSTIKANAGFDKLQAMRDASPTGGALGQVSNIELGLLQSAIGNLEQSQSEKQLRENLQRVRSIYAKIIHGTDAPAPETGAQPKRRKFNAQTGELE